MSRPSNSKWSRPTMPKLQPSLRGPAVVLGVGGGFAFMGALPVAITMAVGMKTSATIIGMGFIGFGIMLIVPGVCWCIAVHHRNYRSWSRRRRLQKRLCRQDAPSMCNEEMAAVELDAVLVCDKSGGGYGGTHTSEDMNQVQSSPAAGNDVTCPKQELLSDHHDNT